MCFARSTDFLYQAESYEKPYLANNSRWGGCREPLLSHLRPEAAQHSVRCLLSPFPLREYVLKGP